MELDRDKKESWLFCIHEALEAYKNRCFDMCQPSDIARLGEITTAMVWIEKELNPLMSFTQEKIKLMQDKGLLHKLYMMQLSGSRRLEPHENAHVADMILRRKGTGNATGN